MITYERKRYVKSIIKSILKNAINNTILVSLAAGFMLQTVACTPTEEKPFVKMNEQELDNFLQSWKENIISIGPKDVAKHYCIFDAVVDTVKDRSKFTNCEKQMKKCNDWLDEKSDKEIAGIMESKLKNEIQNLEKENSDSSGLMPTQLREIMTKIKTTLEIFGGVLRCDVSDDSYNEAMNKQKSLFSPIMNEPYFGPLNKMLINALELIP
jgi:enamine deaminase RidA (YjgF/YER057c/UK114 family)